MVSGPNAAPTTAGGRPPAASARIGGVRRTRGYRCRRTETSMVVDSDATRASIKALLQPSTIAIAGASSDPGKLGSLPLSFLIKHGYAGKIYLVHPKLHEISGIRCFRSMAEIDDDVDLLVIAVPAARIVDLLNECRPGQVKSALILSSGFAETGPEGMTLQRELRNKAFEKGIRFIGPNSVGVANLHDKVIPSISQVFDQTGLAAGRIGFVSQSGAVGTATAARLRPASA